MRLVKVYIENTMPTSRRTRTREIRSTHRKNIAAHVLFHALALRPSADTLFKQTKVKQKRVPRTRKVAMKSCR